MLQILEKRRNQDSRKELVQYAAWKDPDEFKLSL